MGTVCWICGYNGRERRKQGCEPGQCPIPREMHKDADRCLLIVEAAANTLAASAGT